jgi:hypothetical protein
MSSFLGNIDQAPDGSNHREKIPEGDEGTRASRQGIFATPGGADTSSEASQLLPTTKADC